MKEAEAVLRDIEASSEGKSSWIIGPDKGKHLADAVRRFHIKNILEVGTLTGYSAILMAMNLPEDGKVITIERDRRSATKAGENIRRAGLSGKIKVHTGDAIKMIPRLNESFDMVFLDGEKSEYLEYLKLSEKKLKKGGVVFADNVKEFAGYMQDFLNYVRKSGSYRSEFIDAGYDGVELSIKLQDGGR